MRYRSIYTLFGVLLCTVLFFSNSTNPPNKRTGAPGDDGTCATGCHGGGGFQGTVELTGLPTSINHDQSYLVTLTATSTVGSPITGGFQLLALDEFNQSVGDFYVVNGAETGIEVQDGREYIEHRGDKAFSGNSVSWTFHYHAPPGPDNLPITFWFASVLANNNGQIDGDNVITNSFFTTLQKNLNLDGSHVKHISCFGGNDGSIILDVFHGTPPYTYNWSTGQTEPTITGLSAGTYSVTVTDSNGETIQEEFTVSHPADMGLNVVSETYITCISPATISVAANGGTPGYTYLWSTGTTGPTVDLTSPNTVTVEVTDKKGCIKSFDVTPSQDIDPPSVSAFGDTITCLNPFVTLTVQANSPCGAFTYDWTDPNGNSFSNFPDPTVTSPGDYSVLVTDVCNGCTAIANTTVPIFDIIPLISINGTVDTISCEQPIIEIDLAVVPSTNYVWTTVNGAIEFGANEATVGVSKGGIYTVVLTDTINGCTDSLDIQVTESITFTGLTDSLAMPLCFGQSNGYAQLSADGGFSPIVFLWPDSSLLLIRNDLAAGTYSVALSDSLGCVDTVIVIIDQPDPLLANINSTDESVLGGKDGSAWIAPSGGSQGYTVLWNNGETTDTISPLPPGTYIATVTDQNGCTTVKSTKVQAFGCTLDGFATANTISCFGDSTGTILASWLNENGDVIIEWSTGDTTAQVNNLPAGEYTVLITDEGNCTFSDTVIINQSSEIIITVDSIHHTSGPGAMDGAAFVSAYGGANAFTYVWLLNGVEVGFTSYLVNAVAGNYTVEVTDSNGCAVSLIGIEIQDPTSLSQPSWSEQIEVFPIPMNDMLQVRLPKEGNYILRLMDSRGVIHQTLTLQTISSKILTQHLPNGPYWLVIQDTDGGFVLRPLIK